jgi:DNA-binding response OmpR family regulator
MPIIQGFGKKILIVTGDQSIVNRIIEQISSLGHETFIAHNEDMAINTITEIHPDMIILDLNIEGVNSFTVFEWLRSAKDKSIAETPVIIATQGGDLVQISRAIKLGVKDYFVKGTFDVVQVVEKVKKHIDQIPNPSFTSPVGSTPPIASTVFDATPSDVAPTALPTGPKVLIVEDDKFLRDLASQKLSKENLVVISAVDGEQGIAVAEREIPDIVLLDILLPGIDGFEVLRRIRANPTLAKTKVAMLSNFGQREDIEKALKMGANQFMIKANFTLDEIVDEVKKMSVS